MSWASRCRALFPCPAPATLRLDESRCKQAAVTFAPLPEGVEEPELHRKPPGHRRLKGRDSAAVEAAPGPSPWAAVTSLFDIHDGARRDERDWMDRRQGRRSKSCDPVASRENVTEIQTLSSAPTGPPSGFESGVGTDWSRPAYTSFLSMTPPFFHSPNVEGR